MDLEVIGRHALLFDDDASAAFVNSKDALVEWNSLSIDRYDVRHLLSAPPPPRNLRRPPLLPDGALEPDLDRERYLDLPQPSDEQEQDAGKDAELVVDGGYNAVSFSYENPGEATALKNDVVDSVFRPPFPVPESLIQNLPPTEKVHQIIARTAMFVSEHGGQSEIVLRVKQGDNPTFGFLMPDHHLHPYFRHLVGLHELLDRKSLEEEKKGDNGPNQTGGALSLLGSLYGSGEDEDGTAEDLLPETKSDKSQETVGAGSMTASYGVGQKGTSENAIAKNEVVLNNMKEKMHVIKRNRSINTVKSSTTSEVRRDGDALGSVGPATSKSQEPVMPSTSKVELPVLEPPSELKRVVEKIVEFILKNGKEFEAVLAEQDRKFGRFPFLLPSNPYYPYYLKVLQKTQESKLAGKGCVSEKHESMGHRTEKKTTLRRESDAPSSVSIDADIPYDYDKKEKFRMVLGKSKKEGQDPPSKVSQPQCEVAIDADAAAAILKAATSGIKNPSLQLFPKLSGVGIGQGPSDEGGQFLSLGCLHSSQPQSSSQMRNTAGESSVSVPMAETAARAAAHEADSSEASLTREQKLKAERLKRAKMFAAMVKSGAAPLKPEPLRSLSVEPAGSGVSSSGNEVVNRAGKEREGSLVLEDIDTSDKIEKSDKRTLVDECNERRSKRIYRSRSKREDEEEEEEEQEEDDKRDRKHSRKKHRSHRSSHHSRDKHKHRKRHSSSKDRDSRHRHKHEDDSDEYSDDEDQRSQRRHKRSSSSDDDKHRSSRKRRNHHSADDEEHRRSRRHHRHVDSSDDEHRRTRHRRKHGGSSDDEGRERSRSIKHRKHHSGREVELEEGEICAKSDQSKATESERASREASVDLLKSHQQESAPSQPSQTTAVSDDLRAKIRAMLMATLQ